LLSVDVAGVDVDRPAVVRPRGVVADACLQIVGPTLDLPQALDRRQFVEEHEAALDVTAHLDPVVVGLGEGPKLALQIDRPEPGEQVPDRQAHQVEVGRQQSAEELGTWWWLDGPHGRKHSRFDARWSPVSK